LNKANAKTDKAKRIKEIKKELKSGSKSQEISSISIRYIMRLVHEAAKDQENSLRCLLAFPKDYPATEQVFSLNLSVKVAYFPVF
jgi:hypothetical protein